MQSLTAGVRVFAAMPVPIVLELPVNMDYRRVQIDVVTAKAERFVLAQAERECDRPPRAVPPLGRKDQQRPGLGRGQRFAVGLLRLGRINQRAWVPADDLLARSYLQRPGEDAVYLHDRVRPQAFRLQRRVELVQVLGEKPVQVVFAEPGDYPPFDLGPVGAVDRALVLGTLVLLLTVRDQTHGVKYNDNYNDNTLRAPRGDQSLCGGL